METIKKTICLECARSRTQGLMPYYEFCGVQEEHILSGECADITSLELNIASGDNGNWGQFVADPCFLSNANKTYIAMVYNYYCLLNMVREGVKLRKVSTKNGENIFVEDMGTFYFNGVCFKGGNEPETIYDFAAFNADDFYGLEIPSTDGNTKKFYKTNQDIDYDFIILVNDFDKFLGLSKYLEGTDYIEALSSLNPPEIYYFGDDNLEWARYCKVVDLCIGRIDVPASIYNEHLKAPKSMSCADINEYIDWLEKYQTLSADCCNRLLWDEMGGEDMLEFLKDKKGYYEDTMETLNSLEYSVPYIEVPIFLEQNLTDVGVLSTLGGSGASFTSGTSYASMGSTRMHYPTTEEYAANPEIYSASPIVVESLLKTLQGNKRYTDDKDNVLPGLFQKYENMPGGKYIVCEKINDEWVVNDYEGNPDDLKNGDGKESAEVGDKKEYRNVTTEASAKRICEVYDEEPLGYDETPHTTFYFKVKYENSETKPMEIPYKVGNAVNVYLVSGNVNEYIYRGDFIIETNTPSDNGVKYFEVKYVIGGYFSLDASGGSFNYISSGDVYYEKHVLDESHVDYVDLDGVDDVPIYSKYVDFDADLMEFYSSRYNLYRTGNVANIIEMTTGEIWSGDYSFNTYLSKEDYLTNFSLPPKVDVNVTIDRGGVSAFESHFKLSECNTMQDLETYGNGYFLNE